MKLKIFTKVSTFSKQRAHRGEILSKNSWKQDTLVNRAICINEKKKKNCQNCENFTRIYCILSSKREIEEEKRKNEQRDWISRGEIKFSRRENGLLASPRLENCNCTRWKCPIWRVKIEADGERGVKRLERKGLFPIKEAGWPPTTRSDLPLSRTSLSLSFRCLLGSFSADFAENIGHGWQSARDERLYLSLSHSLRRARPSRYPSSFLHPLFIHVHATVYSRTTRVVSPSYLYVEKLADLRDSWRDSYGVCYCKRKCRVAGNFRYIWMDEQTTGIHWIRDIAFVVMDNTKKRQMI